MLSNNGPIDNIKTVVRYEDDLSFKADGAVLLRFTNRGSSRVWIDEDEVLDPGESWTEGDASGPGLVHTYKIQFRPYTKATITADDVKTYTGDRLHIRVFKRSSNANQ